MIYFYQLFKFKEAGKVYSDVKNKKNKKKIEG